MNFGWFLKSKYSLKLISANSSKGSYDFSDKLEALSTNSTFLSQGELTKYALKEEDVFYWTVESIRERQKVLIEFIEDTWNPKTYYQPQDNLVEDEAQNMVDESEVA